MVASFVCAVTGLRTNEIAEISQQSKLKNVRENLAVRIGAGVFALGVFALVAIIIMPL